MATHSPPAAALSLPLHRHSTAQCVVPSSVHGRLQRLLPVHLDVYATAPVRQAASEYECRFAWVTWDAPVPAAAAHDESAQAQRGILASVSLQPPQHLDHANLATDALVISEAAHRLFMHDAETRVQFRPLPAHAIAMWAAVKVRVLRRTPVTLQDLPATLHPLFPIATDSAHAHVALPMRPSLSHLHQQLLEKPVFAPRRHGDSRPLLVLFSDGCYHAVEFTLGRHADLYASPESAMDLAGWGIVTTQTQFEWSNESDSEVPSAASPSAPLHPLQLPISALFQQHLPSFDEELDARDGDEELKSMAFLVKLFASRIEALPSSPRSSPAAFLLLPRSILLSGPAGLGKKTFVSSLARLYGLHAEHVSFGRLITRRNVTGQVGALKAVLEEVRTRASTQRCVLVFHELEIIFASGDERDEEARELQNDFRHFMTSLSTSSEAATGGRASHPLVIGLCGSRSLLSDPVVKAFQYSFKVAQPSNEGRRRILRSHLGYDVASDKPSSCFDCSGVDFSWLVEQTQGYVGGDLVGLIKTAVSLAVQQQRQSRTAASSATSSTAIAGTTLRLTSDHFRVAMDRVRPASLKALNVIVKPKTLAPAPTTNDTVLVDSSTPTTSTTVVSTSTFEGVGGLQAVKAQLRELLLWPLLHADRFRALGIRPTKGILLYGVPGVGKTLLARTVAREFHASFLVMNLPDLLRSGVGESEKRIAELFARARKVAPAIIFLDEVQSVFGRSSAGNDVAAKMMAQLLFQIDALGGGNADGPDGNAGQVLVLGATNLPSAIDPSLLRAGRLDQVLYVGPPDGEARRHILQLSRKDAVWSSEVLTRLDELVRRTDGYSGVDMVQLVGRAGLHALERDPHHIHEVTFADFDQAIRGMTSSITPQMVATCERWGLKQTYAKRRAAVHVYDV